MQLELSFFSLLLLRFCSIQFFYSYKMFETEQFLHNYLLFSRVLYMEMFNSGKPFKPHIHLKFRLATKGDSLR
jgi:hypothetical protein